MAAGAKLERQALEVHLDAAEIGVQEKVGTLFRHATRTDLSASFAYDDGWLKNPRAFLLDPRLELWSGEQYPPDQTPAFGIFLDSAPDRWGRVLMERREVAAAARERRKPSALQEIDFLLGVNDLTRTGALRFRSAGGGPFLDDREDAAPPLTTLRELAYISSRIDEVGAETLPEYERWLAMLVAPGSSLGGARPKASFTDPAGTLWIAKFPARDDRHDVGAWELLLQRLGRKAGIRVPDARLEKLTDRYGTYCVSRFDRSGSDRRMFASARTLLDRRDGDDEGSYLDLAELIANQGAADHISEDLEQLFRRVVFNVMVGNRDDHLRNHGFLRTRDGWRLSPAYDVNPNPFRSDHTLTLDGRSPVPSLDRVLATARFYRLDEAAARKVIASVGAVVASWKDAATALGVPRSEVARMEAVFQVPAG